MQPLTNRTIEVWSVMRAASLPLLLILAVLGCSPSDPQVALLDPSELADEVRAALAEPGILDSNTRLISALRQLSPENLDAVLPVYGELMRDLREPELRPFFDAWSMFDEAAAFAYAMDVPFAVPAKISIQAAMYSWAARNALSARVAADQAVTDVAGSQLQGRKGIAYAITQSLIQGWAISGQDGLQDFLVAVTGDPGQLLLAALPKIYLRSGPEGLIQWCEDFLKATDEYAPRMKAFRYTARTIAFRNPPAAAAFVERHFGEDYANAGTQMVAEAWLERDRDAAIEWLRNDAPEEFRGMALEVAVGRFLSFNKDVAREWIESLPVGDPFYQPAFDSLAKRISQQDPQAALEWCGRGQTEKPNTACLMQAATRWYTQDPVAAGLWMELESGLAEADLADIRKRAKRNLPRTRTPAGSEG